MRRLFALLAVLVLGCGEASPQAPLEVTPAPSAFPHVALARERTSREALKDSVHKDTKCTDCHGEEGGELNTEIVRCAPCHEANVQSFEKSVHKPVFSRDRKEGAQCTPCHGAHDILPASDVRSLAHKRRLPYTCGACHKNPATARKVGLDKDADAVFLDNIHGRALVHQGLIVAPSCVDCHGPSHALQKAAREDSKVHRRQIPRTCGRCHAGTLREFQASHHGEHWTGGERGPVCTDCHAGHQVVHVTGTAVFESDIPCAKCHQDRLKQYFASFHGQAHDLGSRSTAACVDCHGRHDIRSSSDPASSVSDANRAATCRKCHTTAPARLSGFWAHGDADDRENYPLLYWIDRGMTVSLLAALAAFLVHSLLWAQRLMRDRARDPKAWRARQALLRDEAAGPLYRRFSPLARLCHGLLALSFLILVATGMPLKFHESAWAKVAFDVLGGVRVASGLHRVGIAITALYVVLHLVSLLRARNVFGPDSVLPRLQDVRDLGAHLKWFVGSGPRPTFDRFAYWEKFDYLATFLGVTVIGVTGIMLAFPMLTMRFLPGQAVNLALVIHGDTALLFAGLVFVAHSFHVHFRPDRYPIDPVMFTGRVSEARLREERGRQYERLQASGQLEQQRVGDDWIGWKPVVSVLGLLALTIGLLLAVAIFWALGALFFGGG